MIPAHTPFPIGDYDKGLYEAKEPWIAPRNAWETLRNGRVWRGRLLKRTGYTELGQLGYAVEELAWKPTATLSFLGTLANTPILPGKGSYGATFDPGDTTMQLVDQGDSFPGYDALTTYTYSYLPSWPELKVEFTLPDPSELPVAPGTFSGGVGGAGVFYDNGQGEIEGPAVDPAASSSINYETGEVTFWVTGIPFGNLTAEWHPAAVGTTLLFDRAVDRPVPSGISGTDAFATEIMGSLIRSPRWAEGGLSVKGIATSDARDMIGTLDPDDTFHPLYDLVGVDIITGVVNIDTGELAVTFSENTAAVPVCTYVRDAGAINHATGAVAGEFWKLTAFATDVYYEYGAGNPVMGIHSWTDPNGTEQFLVADTRRMWVYSAADTRFNPLMPLADWSGYEFSGDANDLFTFEDWDDRVFVNNGVDPPRAYDPGATPKVLYDPDTNYDGSPGNDITAARFAVRFKGVLVYFATTEGGALQGSRARWPQVGNPEAWRDANDFADAATNEIAQSAHFIGETLYVQFERSVWRLIETGDPNELLAWDKVPNEWGATGKLSTVETSEVLYSRTPYGVVGFDGQGQIRVDNDIPDLTIPWNPAKGHLSQFLRNDTYRQLWLSYADSQEEAPNHALVMQWDESRNRSWSVYDLPFNCYGEYLALGGSVNWDDLTGILDDEAAPWDARDFQGGHTLIAGGSHDGWVYGFDTSDNDDGAAIDFQARTMRLNPFPGQRSHLGYLDLWCSAIQDAEVEIKLYRDYQTAAYRSTTVSIAGTGEKVMRRVSVNRTATWHTIELRSRVAGHLAIDAVVPYFAPAGMVRPIE